MSEIKCKKHWGHRLRLKGKACRKLPGFENLAPVIRHGLKGFIIKNIDGDSKETNDLSRVL